MIALFIAFNAMLFVALMTRALVMVIRANCQRRKKPVQPPVSRATTTQRPRRKRAAYAA